MYDKEHKRLTLRGRKWIHGVALAVLPILTGYGIMSEDMAVLYATLLGTILVPWVALNDQAKHEAIEEENYLRGLDEGWQAAHDADRRGREQALDPYDSKDQGGNYGL